MTTLFNHINEIQKLESEAKAAMQACFFERLLDKNEMLLEAGQVCRHLYFVEEGCLRAFYAPDGKDITNWFAFEHDFVTSFKSAIYRVASVEHIQAIEACRLVQISMEDVQKLSTSFISIERLIKKIYEQYYIRLEDRYTQAHFKTATERYQQLLEEQPHILQRMPLGFVASYLGISFETLSRIRGKM